MWKLLVVAAPCLALLGCARSQAVKYNNDVAQVTKDLEALGKTFGDDLARNAGNPTKQKEIHADATTKATAIIQRGRTLTPPNSTEAQALHKAFLDYLNTEEDIVKNDFPKIFTLLQQNNQAALQNLFNSISQKENARVDALKQAQQNFAKANGFKIQ
jgi:hypothetical protein